MKTRNGMKKVILHFSLKYKGNWEKIYDAIKAKEDVTIEQVQSLRDKYNDNFISIIDDEYPENFKSIYMPPLTIFHAGNNSLLANPENIISLWGNTSYDNWTKSIIDKDKVYAILYNNEMQSNVEKLLEDGYKIILITNQYKNSDIGFLGNYDNCLFITEIPFEVKKADIDVEQTNERLLLGISKMSIMLGDKNIQAFEYLEPLFKFEKRTIGVTSLKQYSESEIKRFNLKLVNTISN